MALVQLTEVSLQSRKEEEAFRADVLERLDRIETQVGLFTKISSAFALTPRCGKAALSASNNGSANQYQYPKSSIFKRTGHGQLLPGKLTAF